jgi:hypothetical protein
VAGLQLGAVDYVTSRFNPTKCWPVSPTITRQHLERELRASRDRSIASSAGACSG